VISLLSIVALGFFLGMRHATDPDHVVAVTTIVSRQRDLKRAALTGISWGIGHTVTILVVGAGIILFNLVIPPRIGLSMEFSVAIMLIILGLVNVWSFLRSIPVGTVEAGDDRGHATEHLTHSHAHPHGDFIHNHPHDHSGSAIAHKHKSTPLAALDRTFGGLSLYQHIRPLVVGIVHGLAGSAAVALLVLTTIQNSYWALAYLLLFGIGTIAGMMLITMSIASAFRFVGSNERFSRQLGMATGLISLAFGIVVAYQIGVVNGLFSSHPQWTPK
jgi:ABC-type nickel/cobalt efflux system permease component RcnA